MPNRHNTKTLSLSQNEPDLSAIKMKSRTKFAEAFGPIIEMNVHEDTRERLRGIAEVLEEENYAEKKRGLGYIYRKAVNDIINIFISIIFLKPKQNRPKHFISYTRKIMNCVLSIM